MLRKDAGFFGEGGSQKLARVLVITIGRRGVGRRRVARLNAHVLVIASLLGATVPQHHATMVVRGRLHPFTCDWVRNREKLWTCLVAL
jgi:hypothetical protein